MEISTKQLAQMERAFLSGINYELYLTQADVYAWQSMGIPLTPVLPKSVGIPISVSAP
jgi:hypothetical protein